MSFCPPYKMVRIGKLKRYISHQLTLTDIQSSPIKSQPLGHKLSFESKSILLSISLHQQQSKTSVHLHRLTKKVRQQSLLEQNEEASKKIAPRGHTIWFINLVQSSAQRDQNCQISLFQRHKQQRYSAYFHVHCDALISMEFQYEKMPHNFNRVLAPLIRLVIMKLSGFD